MTLYHLQSNFLSYITKRWWYCECKLFKNEKICHLLKDDIADKNQIHVATNFLFLSS